MWPECTHVYEGFSSDDNQLEAVNNAAKLAIILDGESFDSITQDEVNDLIDSHSETLADEDLLELRKSVS